MNAIRPSPPAAAAPPIRATVCLFCSVSTITITRNKQFKVSSSQPSRESSRKQFHTRVVFEETPTNYISVERLWNVKFKSGVCYRLLNGWPWKPEDEVVLYLVSRKTKSKMVTPLRMAKYCEWRIMQLLNLAFVGYEEFCRPWKVLFTLAFGLRWTTPSQNSHPTPAYAKIAKYGPSRILLAGTYRISVDYIWVPLSWNVH